MQKGPLLIGQHLLMQILEHCMEERPYEACGILSGRDGKVLTAFATDNLKQSPVFFQVAPDQQEHALQTMADRGEELLGIYHSHPTAMATPSQNDVRMAVHYPEAVRVIVSLLGPTEIRGFVIEQDKVEEIEISPQKALRGVWNDLRMSRLPHSGS